MYTEKNKNKHSKFDTKFVIRLPVEMTWFALKLKIVPGFKTILKCLLEVPVISYPHVFEAVVYAVG